MIDVGFDIRDAARDLRTWALGAALIGSVVVLAATTGDDARLLDRLVFTVIPTGCLWLVAVALLLRHRTIGLTALFVAISPTVLASATAGERHGALAVVCACLGAAFASRGGRRSVPFGVGSAAFVAIGIVVWWRSGAARGRAPGPSWSETLDGTGDVVARGFSVLGPAEVSTPTSGSLLWWCCVGIVVAAALFGRRPLAAASVPFGLLAFVVVSWSITYWRGPVDPAGGMFLVAGAVSFAGSSSTLDDDHADRIAAMLAIAGPAVWAISLVRLARADDSSPVAIAAAALAAAVIAMALWPRGADDASVQPDWAP